MADINSHIAADACDDAGKLSRRVVVLRLTGKHPLPYLECCGTRKSAIAIDAQVIEWCDRTWVVM